jgi:RNA polymerase sigma-70 factor (ECF subfamily)
LVSTTAILRATADLHRGFEREALPHLGAVYNFALRLTRRSENADDLTQETFVRALERFATFTRGTNCKAWLFTIAYSIFVNQYHRRQRELTLVRSEGVDQVPVAQSRPSSSAARAATEADVESALAQLPDEYHATIMLVDVEELSYEEAAEVLSCPVGTVRSRLFRARKLLAEHLHEYGVTGRGRS